MHLEVRDVTKTYPRKGGEPPKAVDGLSFDLAQGRILAFLGPNGAGKTTSIKMIAGLVKPDAGEIRVDGTSLIQEPQAAFGKIGAVLEGSRNLYWRLTPMENIAYWAGIRGVPKREAQERGMAFLVACGLEKKAHDTVQKLSRGMQQLVAIACSILHRPKLLLLDEPTLGLDLWASDRIQELIVQLAKSDDVAVLVTTHQMEVAQRMSDEVLLIRGGKKVLSGRTEEILRQFRGNTYSFQLGAQVSASQRAYLLGQGAAFEDESTFRVSIASPSDLYQIISHLDPLPIDSVSQDGADLASVFRQVIGEGQWEVGS